MQLVSEQRGVLVWKGTYPHDLLQTAKTRTAASARALNPRILAPNEFDDPDDYQIYEGVADQDLGTEHWWDNLTPLPGWHYGNSGKSREAPAILYLAGGHIATHSDPCWGWGCDTHTATYLHCYDAHDPPGGTAFFHPHAPPTIRRESVTPGAGIVFPGYLPHSGIPVSDRGYKLIGQFIIRATKNRVPPSWLVKIPLADGHAIVRRDEAALLTRPLSELRHMTTREFHPTLCALRGHPTYDHPLVPPELTAPGGSPYLYDATEPGWYHSLDEATYHADGHDLLATITLAGRTHTDVPPHALGTAATDLYTKHRADPTPHDEIPQPPFTRLGHLALDDGPVTYAHVAWRIDRRHPNVAPA